MASKAVPDDQVLNTGLEVGVSARLSAGYRMFKTVIMVLCMVALGIFLELAGPTLPDLQRRLGVNYEEISRVLAARSVGAFVGSVCGGFLADTYGDHLEFLLFLSFLLAALATTLAPWATKLWLLGIFFHVQGIAHRGIDTSNNLLCLKLWGSEAGPPIHALHFGFGVGAMIAPQLARPFISDTQANSTNNTNNSETAPVEIPYSVSGIISLTFSLCFLAFYIYDRFHERKEIRRPTTADIKRMFHPGSCASGRLAFGIQIFILILLYYFNAVGGENSFSRFLYSYATKTGKFDRDSASALNTVFWICFSAGRGVAIVAAHWISPRYLIPVEIFGNLVSAIVLSVWGYHVPAVLWVFSSVYGVSIAPIFPAGLAWSNLFVEMSGMAVAMVFIGGSCGGAFYQWFTGYLFQYKGPETLMYVILGYSVFISLVFTMMTLLTCHVPERFSESLPPEKREEDITIEICDTTKL